jgi:hypothetical protein
MQGGNEMIIPNAVGRIDAITDAIREGDRGKAQMLLAEEAKRLARECKAAHNQYVRYDKTFNEVIEFYLSLGLNDALWRQARIDCGWQENT